VVVRGFTPTSNEAGRNRHRGRDFSLFGGRPQPDRPRWRVTDLPIRASSPAPVQGRRRRGIERRGGRTLLRSVMGATSPLNPVAYPACDDQALPARSPDSARTFGL